MPGDNPPLGCRDQYRRPSIQSPISSRASKARLVRRRGPASSPSSRSTTSGCGTGWRHLTVFAECVDRLVNSPVPLRHGRRHVCRRRRAHVMPRFDRAAAFRRQDILDPAQRHRLRLRQRDPVAELLGDTRQVLDRCPTGLHAMADAEIQGMEVGVLADCLTALLGRKWREIEGHGAPVLLGDDRRLCSASSTRTRSPH